MQEMRFRPGSRWGAYRAPTDPLAGLRGPTSKGRGRGEGQAPDSGMHAPLLKKSWIKPWLIACIYW